MGSEGTSALLESSVNSVVVKTFVMASAGISLANGALDRVSSPIPSWAVDATMSISWMFGG